jgi:hypothetical protein
MSPRLHNRLGSHALPVKSYGLTYVIINGNRYHGFGTSRIISVSSNGKRVPIGIGAHSPVYGPFKIVLMKSND